MAYPCFPSIVGYAFAVSVLHESLFLYYAVSSSIIICIENVCDVLAILLTRLWRHPATH